MTAIVVEATTTPQLRIALSSINVRSGPGSNFASIAILRRDEVVEVIARTQNGRWFNVRLPDESTGWVAANVTELVDATSVEDIPVAATIPVPPTHTPRPTSTPTATPRPTDPPPPAPLPTDPPPPPTSPPPTEDPGSYPPPPTEPPDSDEEVPYP